MLRASVPLRAGTLGTRPVPRSDPEKGPANQRRTIHRHLHDCANERARQTFSQLEKRLERLTGELQLPELDPADIVNGLVSVGREGLRLNFSTMRISRADSAEQWFAKSLLAIEPDLIEQNEPMVFPIFGRGRVLHALVGPGLNPQTIEEAAKLLTAKCSCQIKELSPGSDLIFKADWGRLLRENTEASADLISALAQKRVQPETVIIRGTPPPPGGIKATQKDPLAASPIVDVQGWAIACVSMVAAAAAIGLTRNR